MTAHARPEFRGLDRQLRDKGYPIEPTYGPRTKADIMDGVDHVKARKLTGRSVEYWRANGDRVIRLHRTDIVTFHADRRVSLDTGGWQTPTTRQNMMEHLPQGVCIWGDKRRGGNILHFGAIDIAFPSRCTFRIEGGRLQVLATS